MKIQIICTSPGMRRNGIEHPPSAFYDADRWTDTQLQAFRKDPSFVVREVDDQTENTMTDTDFTLRVDAEVKRLVALKADQLQAGFADALANAVAEKTASLKAEHDNAMDAIGKQLSTASDGLEKAAGDLAAKESELTEAYATIAELQHQLTDAKKPAAKAAK